MARCESCKLDVPRGSRFCPRCGEVVDDGLDRRGQRRRVIIAFIVGIVCITLLLMMFTAHRVPIPLTKIYEL